MNYLDKRDILFMLKGIETDKNGNMILPKRYDYVPQAIKIDNGNVYKSEIQVVDITPKIVRNLIEYIEKEMEK